MYELTRGYAAAILDEAQPAGALPDIVSGVGVVRSALVRSEPLRTALTDPSIPAGARAAVLADLLDSKVAPGVVSLATFAVSYERAGEIPKTFEILLELVEAKAERSAAGVPVELEPPIGRSGGLERIRGYAERVFEQLAQQESVDAVEDELFRFARIAEQHRELRTALATPTTPFEVRYGVLSDLLDGKVRPETLALSAYVLRAGRARDIVSALDYLVELAAAERGRRVADVRAAVELSADESDRLARALSERTRRTVELRVAIDPSVIGGIGVVIGDTVIDGTVRHRLDQLRETLIPS